MRSEEEAGRRVRRLASTLLLVLAARQLGASWSAPGIDFVQYWAVAKTRALTAGVLHDPYTQGAGMSAALDAWAARESDDPQLQAAAAARRHLELVQSPLLYAACALLPSRYEWALALFRALQLVALAVGLLLVVRAAGGSTGQGWMGLALLVCAGAYYPLAADVQVGNVNLLQWGALAVLLRMVQAGFDRRPAFGDTRAPRELVSRSAIIFITAGALVLVKPNLLLACGALAAVWVRRAGGASSARGAALAAPALLALGVWPCLWMGSAGVWGEWLGTAGRLSAESVAVDAGNYAFSVLVGRALGVPTVVVSVLVAALLAVVLAFRGRAVLDDPPLAVALALAATLLAAPLVWLHYYVLLLPAAIVLLTRGRVPAACAGAAVFVSSALADGAWHHLGVPGAVPWFVAGSAVLLLGGGLTALRTSVLTPGAPAH